MQKAFCTISTRSHLSQVQALHASLEIGSESPAFFVLITDGVAETMSGISQLQPADLKDAPFATEICAKYQEDRLRWALKPVLLRHLLEGYKQVIYLDNDLFFFQEADFLFDELAGSNLLLSPHWRTLDPAEDRHEFENHFTDGLYNAGFVGAATGAQAALDWWAKACLHKMVKDPSQGYFDDQRYLDLLPVYFPPVKVLQHRGCNVAYWNRRALSRIKVGEEVLIQGEWPIVFIHFTASLIGEILDSGREALLRPYLNRYLETLREYDPDFEFSFPLSSSSLREKIWRFLS